MDSFFTELKTAREAKGISLAEISDATLINVKMLETLERGNVDVLPQAYIRAFLREYAGVIGLDKDEIMKQYEAWLKSKETPPPSVPSPESKKTLADLRAKDVRKVPTFYDKFELMVPTIFKIIVAIVVLVLVDIVLWSVLEKEPKHSVKETPFGEMVKENEERAGVSGAMENDETVSGSTPTKDSTGISAPKTSALIPSIFSDKDSMTLVATTTDSVWMQIVVDSEILTEHSLLPQSTFRWKAKNEFWISAIGNPEAIKLTLNNTPIQVPVKRGFVTRDLRLNRETLSAR
jgi:cytoskeletal protein RodZ